LAFTGRDMLSVCLLDSIKIQNLNEYFFTKLQKMLVKRQYWNTHFYMLGKINEILYFRARI